jgi:hypothetical protein
MNPKQLKELTAAAQGLRTEAQVNAWLDAKRIFDPTDRISLKLELMASGELSTDQRHDNRLATDTAVYQPAVPPVNSVMERWLRRANLRLDRDYTEREVDEALAGSGLDTVVRMSLKCELMDRNLLRASAPARRGLQAGRDMRGSADRPRHVLRDRAGRPVTLTSVPE